MKKKKAKEITTLDYCEIRNIHGGLSSEVIQLLALEEKMCTDGTIYYFKKYPSFYLQRTCPKDDLNLYEEIEISGQAKFITVYERIKTIDDLKKAVKYIETETAEPIVEESKINYKWFVGDNLYDHFYKGNSTLVLSEQKIGDDAHVCIATVWGKTKQDARNSAKEIVALHNKTIEEETISIPKNSAIVRDENGNIIGGSI